MSGNDFLEKAHNKVLAEAEQLRADVARLQADVARLQADVARWQATAEAEQLRAQAVEVERDRLVDRHIVRDGYGRYWITNASNYVVTGNNVRMFLGGPFSDRAGAVATVLEMAGLPIGSDIPELAGGSNA